MRLITSKQKDVLFVFCASPITIDKRASWGSGDENLQYAPDGAFLKMNGPLHVSHLVQPNAEKSAPVGWVPGSGPGLYNKAPIWITDKVVPAGRTTIIAGLDGAMKYTMDEEAMVCYNDLNGAPNLADGWVQTLKALSKNYNV